MRLEGLHGENSKIIRFAEAPRNLSFVSKCGSEKNQRDSTFVFRRLLDSNWEWGLCRVILVRGLAAQRRVKAGTVKAGTRNAAQDPSCGCTVCVLTHVCHRSRIGRSGLEGPQVYGS